MEPLKREGVIKSCRAINHSRVCLRLYVHRVARACCLYASECVSCPGMLMCTFVRLFISVGLDPFLCVWAAARMHALKVVAPVSKLVRLQKVLCFFLFLFYAFTLMRVFFVCVFLKRISLSRA